MIGKSGIECFYYGKISHTTINCKTCANDLLKGKLKESTNVAIVDDLLDTNNCDDPTEQLELFAF
jgi:adenine/guanine phosphoribosyltransferase-like PRPP-binding protein